MDIRKIQKQLAEFADDRDWEQFHSPKNLAMALAAESGELLELFQWLTEEQSAKICETDTGRAGVEEEVADIAIYLLRLCDKLDIDLNEAVARKIVRNGEKYPADLVKGRADKYSKY